MARAPRKVEHVNHRGVITEYPWKAGVKALARARAWPEAGAAAMLAEGVRVPDGAGGHFVMLQRLWV